LSTNPLQRGRKTETFHVMLADSCRFHNNVVTAGEQAADCTLGEHQIRIMPTNDQNHAVAAE
jgi:hypothetical protein